MLPETLPAAAAPPPMGHNQARFVVFNCGRVENLNFCVCQPVGIDGQVLFCASRIVTFFTLPMLFGVVSDCSEI